MKKLLIATLFYCCMIPSVAFSQMGKVDTRYVDENSFLVFQFDIEKLISYEKMGSKDIDDISTVLKKQAGIDLRSLKTITIQFGDGADPKIMDEDSFSMFMTFSRPIDQKAFLEISGFEYEEVKHEGQTFHQSGNEYAPSCFFPDEKTLVMAMAEPLKMLMKKKVGDAPISALLNSATPGSEVIGAFRNTKAFKTILAELQRGLPAITPINLENVYGEAETGFFQTQVKSSTPMFIQLNCKTEAAAKKVASKTKFLADFGKESIPLGRDVIKAQAKQMEDFAGPNFPPEFKKAMVARMELYSKALDMGDKILGATSCSHEGKTARVKVKLMGGVRDVVSVVTQSIASQFRMIEEMSSLDGSIDKHEPVEEADDSDAIDR